MTAAKYSTYDPVYVRTYCTTRPVIDLLGLSHAAQCAPRTYCNWTIIRWGRAALRCSPDNCIYTNIIRLLLRCTIGRAYNQPL